MALPKKILVIEDSKFTTEMIKGTLQKASFQVEPCDTGQEGLQKAKTLGPDLIILDVVMPGMDGYEVCHHLKQDVQTKAIPVMMLTVKDTLDDLHRGFKVAADYYMTKPFTEASLLDNVQKIFAEQDRPSQKGVGA